MTYPKLVSWSYYDGDNFLTKKKNKEHVTLVYALSPEAEAIAATGQVAALNSDVSWEDPYFRVDRKYGYTSKARNHGNLRNTYSKKYPGLKDRLSGISRKIKDYGDYIYIDLAFVQNYNNPLVGHSDIFKSEHFIPKEKWTKETLNELLIYRPYSLMGTEIDAYKQRELPALLLALKIDFPDMYDDLKSTSAMVQEIDASLTYEGKTAYVHTLLPGKVEVQLTFLNSETYNWDGTTLTKDTKAYDGSQITITIQPSNETTVKVLDDNTVTLNTVFKQ